MLRPANSWDLCIATLKRREHWSHLYTSPQGYYIVEFWKELIEETEKDQGTTTLKLTPSPPILAWGSPSTGKRAGLEQGLSSQISYL